MKITNKILGILSIILLAVFLPVLFCVAVIGNHMDYTETMKIITRLPNQVLLLIALIGLMICVFLFRKSENIKLSPRVNWIVNAVLSFLFLALYFVNIRIAKEIAFYLPWDIQVVRAVADTVANEQRVGYIFYFSMYSNNIPITYILGRLLRKAMHMQNYPYNADFIWIQVNCALISIAGFFSCLTVKKLTKKLMPVVLVFFLYLVLVWLSPWKIAPYTDTYGLIFPVICLYFYVSYRKAEHVWSKYLCILLSIAAGMLGGFVKPNIYIVIIAILAAELICCFTDFKKRWGFILTEIALVIVLAIGNRAYARHIIDEIGFDFNPEIEASWQHYFLMGLNEYSTGGYNMDDVAMFGQYDTSKSDRIHAEMKLAAERMKERGFFGSIYFYLRKMVMTFNDGVFGWRTEVWIQEYYPDSIASNTALTQWLRSIFWGSGNEMGIDVKGYNTLCQLVWIFSILGIPGICLCKDGKRQEYGILIICFLGIFFYQMLFEARARYLFVFLPILLTMSVLGINQYTYCLKAFWEKRKNKANVINRISMVLMFFVLILSLTGCGRQTDGTTDAGSAEAGYVKVAESVQDGEEQPVNDDEPLPEDAETEQQEPVTEYPIFTEVDSRWVNYVMESEGVYCVYVDDYDNGSYSFLTEAGEKITSFNYPEATPFNEGLACVCLDGKYGYIDTNGDTALEFIYDYATPFAEGLAYFAIGDSYGFMNKNGEAVFYLDCDSVSSFKEGFAYFSLDGKYGYIDRTGAVVIEPVYDDADYFDHGVAKVRIGGSYGMIDCEGCEILPVDYERVEFSYGYLLAEKDERCVCYGPDGRGGWKLLLEGDSVYPWEYGERTFLKYTIGGKAGLADEDGRVLFESYDDHITLLEDTGYVLTYVYEEGTFKYEIRDLQGDSVVPFGEYDFMHDYGADASVGLLEVEKDGMRGFLSLEDMTLKIPAVWQDVGSFHRGGHYTWVQLNDQYGIIDTEGNLIYPVEYEEAKVFENDSVALWKDGVVALYDARGGLLYRARGCRYITLKGECYEVRLGNYSRYLTLDGKRVDTEYFNYTKNVQTNIYVAGSYGTDKNDFIIKTGEAGEPVAEIDGAILKNAITPRIGPFYQIFLGRMSGEPEDKTEASGTLGTEIFGCSRPLFRLYAVEGCKEPLLYYYEEPFEYSNFPYSVSGFYQLQGDGAVEIISGYECGGSMRGDYAALWYDKETGTVLPGLDGSWGGFGGSASGKHIYRNEGNGFEDAVSFYATTMNDSEDTDYEVDGKYVTEERYREVRDQYKWLSCIWY